MTFTEFLQWLVQDPAGITVLTTKISLIVGAVLLAIKSVRTAICDFITGIRDAIKGTKKEDKEKTK